MKQWLTRHALVRITSIGPILNFTAVACPIPGRNVRMNTDWPQLSAAAGWLSAAAGYLLLLAGCLLLLATCCCCCWLAVCCWLYLLLLAGCLLLLAVLIIRHLSTLLTHA